MKVWKATTVQSAQLLHRVTLVDFGGRQMARKVYFQGAPLALARLEIVRVACVIHHPVD